MTVSVRITCDPRGISERVKLADGGGKGVKMDMAIGTESLSSTAECGGQSKLGIVACLKN